MAPDSLTAAGSPRTFTVALAGQPNSGKSTVFNVLTGLDQHVGNWPGKTLEKREGVCTLDGCRLRIVDLPGTYALSAGSDEERLARNVVLHDRPDVVAVIVDATALERSLYLVAELLWLRSPVVVGLNMMDVAARRGIRVEPDVLETALGLPVVPMVANRNQGVREFAATALAVADGTRPCEPRGPAVRRDHQREHEALRELVAGAVPVEYPEEWIALKLLEGDDEITSLVRGRVPADRWLAIEAILARHEDGVLAVAGGRHEWIGRMVRAAIVRPRAGQVTVTERLDRVATHPVWGLFALAGLLGALFWVTYAVGVPLQRALDGLIVHESARWVRAVLDGAPPWMSSLVADGVLGGAGTALTLLPILVIFFAAFGLLEDSGYMTRGAYVMDRFMHPIGLHGSSFLSLCLGFGCNVPAVLGTRALGERRHRVLTALLAPLVPCSGRMAVIAVLAPVFFPGHAALVAWGLVGLNLAILALLGLALRRPVVGKRQLAFIMELPLYHAPHPASILRGVWRRTIAFVRNAGSIIVIGAIVVWLLSRLPGGEVDTSYLAAVGRAIAPIGAWLGLDWRMLTALLSSFVAKENAIATLGVLYGAAGSDRSLGELVAQSMTPASGLAMMVMQMMFIPCLATVATLRSELGRWKWVVVDLVVLLATSFVVAGVVYFGALAAGLG
ncbi:MAG: ferrous iron transport protein B [Acidobacteriota bacterium]